MNRKRNRPEDWEDLEPSPVIHIRELPEHTLEIDLQRTFECFGKIRDITMLPNKSQALVEFYDIGAAESVVKRSTEEMIIVAGRRVKVNFSTSKRIVQRTTAASSDDGPNASAENKILLLTIYNAQYPITVDVINQITLRHGRVARIVIFRKSGVQAMVEFKTVEEARVAKRHLNGADIYSGCCTLKVEFARPTRLTVSKNDQDTWDFENHLPQGSNGIEGRNQTPASLLGRFDGQPSMGGFPQRFENGRPPAQGIYGISGNNMAMNPPGTQMINNMAMCNQVPGPQPPVMTGSMEVGMSSSTPVVMVYGLDMNRVNCDRLFNLLCIYGNVWRIKFLRTKSGSAMAQMGDPASVDRAVNNLSNLSVFGSRITLRPSKQASILEVPQPYELPDGSPSYKDYVGSRDNRYINPEMASKNRVFLPSKTVHFWNCPPNFSSGDMRDVFLKNGAEPPEQFLAFTKGSEKSTSGLIEWQERCDAAEGIMLCNHATIPYPEGRYPFIMKLSYSNTPINERNSHTENFGSRMGARNNQIHMAPANGVY